MVESTPVMIKNSVAESVTIPLDEYNKMFPNIESEYFNLQVAGYFLPEMKFCSRYFLRGVFTGHQECPLTSEMKPTHVKRYKEVSIKALMGAVKLSGDEKEIVYKYLPKPLKNKKPPRISRNWLITICNTFAPKALKVVLDAAENVHTQKAEKAGSTITLNTEIAKKVVSDDFKGIAYTNKHSKKRVRTFKPKYAETVTNFDTWFA